MRSVYAIAAGLIAVSPPALAGAPAKIERAPESMLNRLILEPAAVKRLGIRTGPVTREAVPRTLRVGGQVVPRPGSAALLRAPMAGTVEAPPGADGPLPPGTALRAGQTVLRLRPLVAPSQNLLAETRRDLAQAEARRDTADKAKARADQLLKEGAGDQAGLELASQALAIAEAELRAARARVAQARSDPLGADVALPLRAPLAGTVLRLLATEGQTVSAGDPLVEVVSPEAQWVRVPIYVGRVAEVDRAAPALVRRLGADPTQPGVSATSIDATPVPSPDGTIAALQYSLPSDAPLSPGARVMVQLTLRGSSQPVPTLPRTAIFFDHQGAAWVYLEVEERTYARHRIEVEDVVGPKAILREAPPSNAKVVLVGAMELYGTEFGIGK